jgi:hypothetical protein
VLDGKALIEDGASVQVTRSLPHGDIARTPPRANSGSRPFSRRARPSVAPGGARVDRTGSVEGSEFSRQQLLPGADLTVVPVLEFGQRDVPMPLCSRVW